MDYKHATVRRIPQDQRVVGVEVGVWKGANAVHMLTHRPQLELYLVDPWSPGEPGTSWWKSGSSMPGRSQEEFDAAHKIARDAMAFAGTRASFVRLPSIEAASYRPARSLDFVFIDGDHSKAGCLLDILAWLPTIKVGGWIGGRDYADPRFLDGGVAAAVQAIFAPDRVELDLDTTWFAMNLTEEETAC